MRISTCRDALAAALASTRIAAHPYTSLEREGKVVAGMAQAYQKDGATFYTKGDLVNALAAFWYGAGWLHLGMSSGYLISEEQDRFCPFTGDSEKLPQELAEKLAEKTQRYEHLLNTARSSVECAGEPTTISNEFAGKILFISGRYLAQGTRYRTKGTDEDALACFSYGHGWLDAGVTCGYFHITAHHDIFTV